MTATDAKITDMVRASVVGPWRCKWRWPDGTLQPWSSSDPDRDDYFYLHLDNGQVFRIEVTEVHNRGRS